RGLGRAAAGARHRRDDAGVPDSSPPGELATVTIALGRAAWAAGLAALCTIGTLGADPLRFPAVDRPVAPIISPAYSTEAERDRHGEAERVMNRLGVTPGMRVADIGAGA